ncbi:MAG: flagellar motor protein MotB [Paracoccus sp. (in: a-proteobacteria)]|uniref:flagellar motor protein MotB n=1 Tax=Paracoccus sp. TaxID=267 RepID=UPI0026E0B1C7|nr:flagellar motor protein MotB [Paracoccus sp. (in: a-proteobacteria)]MDO5613764.1 flagellar motor protein MotB [Paracoccus sp. (in: a-proteobacteria)]
MAADKGRASAPIIIKRVQVGGGGHHGGAWKVAYADFVTAMMAFFLLMWLLNATTEKQRRGLADYFDPTIMQSQTGSGDSVEDGQGQAEKMTGDAAQFQEMVKQIQDALTGSGAESMQHTNALRHVVTRLTDEGLVIELSDLTDEPLFVEDTAQPHQVTRELADILARVLGRVRNDLAISGHVRAYPAMMTRSPVWPLSDARAHTVRNLLEQANLDGQRIQRVTGWADRKNRSANPMDPANNRIEVILLR